MRVLIAPDKFAGTLTAAEAAAAIASGLRQATPDVEPVLLPLSDGGPGLLEVAENARGGRRVPVDTVDPLGRPLRSEVLVSDGDVYVESALAIGLHLLTKQERDPERATSAGLADLLRAALAQEGLRIIVGLGGSATVDGGRGMIEALGADGDRLRQRELVALCDVDNPLLGISGAAAVFGPQKGADASAVQRLEAKLRAWAEEIGLPADQPGAGAAGGLGAALFFLGATRAPGTTTVAELVGLADHLRGCDLVITGEGSYDFQSLRGKVVAGVAQAALAEAVPCVVLAGQVSVGRREMLAGGVNAAYSLVDAAGSVEAAMANPAAELSRLAARVGQQWLRGDAVERNDESLM
jgi:glycerate kinase